MLSMTTDFRSDKGCPRDDLRMIAQAGFTHVHWCHHWNDDFLYGQAEIEQIAAWFKESGLSLRDLHASAGVEKNWGSLLEYERQAGAELVANRIEMTSRLGADVIILHLPPAPASEDQYAARWVSALTSLDELRPVARQAGVRIAIENGAYEIISRLLDAYEPEFLGLCYDCGHGNLNDGLDQLDKLKGRLISIHLHDNDGTGDQHQMPFTGTVDWPRLAGLIAASRYRKGVNCEAVIGKSGLEPAQWLAQAYKACEEFQGMLDAVSHQAPAAQ
jgi:sugar phosphate isomerase/epimerase